MPTHPARLAALAGILALSGTVASARPMAPVTAEVEKLLEHFEQAQRTTRTMSAEFTQTKVDELFVEPIVQTGRFFFTNPDGFFSVIWGSLDYWVSQQHERRGDQPDYYYFMTMPVYEFLPLALGVAGGLYYAIRGQMRNALIVAGGAILIVAMLLMPHAPALLRCHGDQCKPTAKVERPMMNIVIRNVYFRPTRSPIRPNTSAPNGRTANPAAKAASARMKPVVSLTPEKNCFEMIAERAP